MQNLQSMRRKVSPFEQSLKQAVLNSRLPGEEFFVGINITTGGDRWVLK